MMHFATQKGNGRASGLPYVFEYRNVILSNFIVIQLSMITSIYTLNNLPITVYLIAYQDMYLIWVYKNTDSRLDTFNR